MAKEETGLISSTGICLAMNHYYTTTIRNTTIHVIIACLNTVLSLFGTLANVLIIISYCRNRHLRTIQNFVFVVLASADLITTALVQPLFIVGNLSGVLGVQNCIFSDVRTLSTFLSMALSMLTIIILSIKSWIFLACPYRCQSMITKFRLKIIVGICWCIPLFITTVAVVLARSSILLYGALLIIVLTLLIVTVTWIWTYKLVCRHRKAIHVNQTPSTCHSVTERKVFRSTFTAVIIVSSLLACSLPAIGVLIYRAGSLSSPTVEHKYLFLQSVTFTLMYANSLVNPCLVFWRSSHFRETAMNLC